MRASNNMVTLDPPAEVSAPGRGPRQWWTAISGLLMAAIFTQAVFAGLMLSGIDWASRAHRLNAMTLTAAALVAGLVSVAVLRRVPHGWKFALTLLVLAAVILAQTAVGALSAKGANLMWLHIPLGVALVGLAGQAVAGARKLGG